MYYVYIIQSLQDGSFYKGFTEDPVIRLERHNHGETMSTRHKLPWKLVYVEQQKSKRSALIRERNLKKADRQRIESLLAHSKNIVTQFLPEPEDSVD